MRPLGSAWRCLATVLVVVGLLSGCTVGPNYRRPEVIVPADWRNAPEQRDSLGDLGWWGIFQDPALHELLSTAVVANRDVQVAVARVLESRAHLGVARAAQFPQVNAGASYQYTRPNSENSPFLNGSRGRSPFTGDDFETSVDLAFELDLWGRLRRATEAARAELLAREENRGAVLITLVSDVARTYFDLLELDQELEIARRTLQTRQESLQLQRRRFQQGLSTQLDVDRADAEAAVAAATVPDLERRIAQNENALSVLFFFSSRRRHTRFDCDWSSDVCSSDLSLHELAYSAPAEYASSCSDRKNPRAGGRARSEERRVGKECRSRWSPYH